MDRSGNSAVAVVVVDVDDVDVDVAFDAILLLRTRLTSLPD